MKYWWLTQYNPSMDDYIPPKPIPTAPWWVGINVLLFTALIGVGIAREDVRWYAWAMIVVLPLLAFVAKSIWTERSPWHSE